MDPMNTGTPYTTLLSTGCELSVTVIILENGISNLCSKPGTGYLLPLHANKLGKGMNSSVFPYNYRQILGKTELLCFCKVTSLGERKLNSNQQ